MEANQKCKNENRKGDEVVKFLNIIKFPNGRVTVSGLYSDRQEAERVRAGVLKTLLEMDKFEEAKNWALSRCICAAVIVELPDFSNLKLGEFAMTEQSILVKPKSIIRTRD